MHAEFKDKTGREDENFASILLNSSKGADLSNLNMKVKIRATLSICGLGMLDDSELEKIPKEVIKEREVSG